MLDIPDKASAWERLAKDQGVYGKSIRDFERVPSASKMEEATFLSLKVLWTTSYANQLDAKSLGLAPRHVDAAEKHLRDSRAWSAYLDHIGEMGNSQVSLGEMPDLGPFTLARYFNLQIRQSNSVQESVKHDISPIATRTRSKTAVAGGIASLRLWDSRPATPVNENSSFDLSTLKESLPTRENIASEDSSFSSQDSPLTRKSKSVGGPTGLASERGHFDNSPPLPQSTENVDDGPPGRSSNDSSSESGQSTEASLAAHSIDNASAAAILYPPTEDEQIVNMGLLLFLGALCAHCPLATSEWSPVRKAFQVQLKNANIQARTDGYLRGKDGQTVKAIVEVKARSRGVRASAILMQESTQMVAWMLNQQHTADPEPGRFVLISQDLHHIFITIADYTDEYIEYLNGNIEATSKAAFLKMRCYGPWDIFDRSFVANLGRYLLAFTIKASEDDE